MRKNRIPKTKLVSSSKIRFKFKLLPNLKYKQRVFFVGFFTIIGLLLKRLGHHETIYNKIKDSLTTTSSKKETYQTKPVITEPTQTWTTKKMVRDPLGRMVEATTRTTEPVVENEFDVNSMNDDLVGIRAPKMQNPQNMGQVYNNDDEDQNEHVIVIKPKSEKVESDGGATSWCKNILQEISPQFAPYLCNSAKRNKTGYFS